MNYQPRNRQEQIIMNNINKSIQPAFIENFIPDIQKSVNTDTEDNIEKGGVGSGRHPGGGAGTTMNEGDAVSYKLGKSSPKMNGTYHSKHEKKGYHYVKTAGTLTTVHNNDFLPNEPKVKEDKVNTNKMKEGDKVKYQIGDGLRRGGTYYSKHEDKGFHNVKTSGSIRKIHDSEFLEHTPTSTEEKSIPDDLNKAFENLLG